MIRIPLIEADFVNALREERWRLDNFDPEFGHASWMYEKAYRALRRTERLMGVAKTTFMVAVVSFVQTMIVAIAGLPSNVVVFFSGEFLLASIGTISLALLARRASASWHQTARLLQP